MFVYRLLFKTFRTFTPFLKRSIFFIKPSIVSYDSLMGWNWTLENFNKVLWSFHIFLKLEIYFDSNNWHFYCSDRSFMNFWLWSFKLELDPKIYVNTCTHCPPRWRGTCRGSATSCRRTTSRPPPCSCWTSTGLNSRDNS